MKKGESLIEIREERPEDYRETELITMNAFWNRYAPGCNEFLLVRKLRKAKAYLPQLSRVAVRDGKIVGVIMYSVAKIQYGDITHEVLTFGPLCADRSAQDCGVGGKLLETTMQLCKDAGYEAIVIFGEPNYYPKHGFVTCDHLGLTTMDGSNFDSFMGIELKPGALTTLEKKYGCKGRFSEDEALEDLPDEETEAMRKEFPELPKLKLPGQWGFPNPTYEKDGYQLLEAVQMKKAFINMFNIYAHELSRYNPWLATQISMEGNYLEEYVKEYFANPAKRPFIILCDSRPAGMFVVSGQNDSFDIEEFFVTIPYRKKGIATNIVKLLLSQVEKPCEISILEKNESAIQFWEKLFKDGKADYTKENDGNGMWNYHIKNN